MRQTAQLWESKDTKFQQGTFGKSATWKVEEDKNKMKEMGNWLNWVGFDVSGVEPWSTITTVSVFKETDMSILKNCQRKMEI
jgi:hypothetical protein